MSGHPRPWHRDSLFGDGPRHPLTREQRARFRFLARVHRAAGRLTACAHDVAEALVRRIGTNGQLDPGHDTLAGDAMCCARTVRRALVVLRELGLLAWQRRIARRVDGVIDQVSNAYWIITSGVPPAPAPSGQNGRQTELRNNTIAIERDPDARAALLRHAKAAEARFAAAWETRHRLQQTIRNNP